MNSLEALNDLRNSGLVKDDIVCFTKKALEKRLDIIETTLKDYETLKKEHEFLSEHFNELLNENRKEHRVIEIIKEKVGLRFYYCDDLKKYAIEIGGLQSYVFNSKMDYDLVKEILDNE